MGRVGLRIQVYVQAGARAQVQMSYILACVQERDILSCVQERDILACVKERDILVLNTFNIYWDMFF